MSTRLTTTTYGILSLLALRPWSSYELIRQMDRSVGRIWPRAKSKLYEEPKKLVAHGLAEAETQHVGQRSRVMYAITEQGRAALREWHAEPGGGPVLEFEQLLKLCFAEHGTKADALATLAAARSWAEERNRENLSAARQYAAAEGPFPERAPQNLLVGRFLTDYYRLVAEWSDWATSTVKGWPADSRPRSVDQHQIDEVVRRATW